MCKTRITKILIATLCVILQFFLRLNYLEMHRTYGCSANPNRARPLCDYCGRKFCQPQKLKVHIKRMHSGTCLSYTCPSTDIHNYRARCRCNWKSIQNRLELFENVWYQFKTFLKSFPSPKIYLIPPCHVLFPNVHFYFSCLMF